MILNNSQTGRMSCQRTNVALVFFLVFFFLFCLFQVRRIKGKWIKPFIWTDADVVFVFMDTHTNNKHLSSIKVLFDFIRWGSSFWPCVCAHTYTHFATYCYGQIHYDEYWCALQGFDGTLSSFLQGLMRTKVDLYCTSWHQPPPSSPNQPKTPSSHTQRGTEVASAAVILSSVGIATISLNWNELWIHTLSDDRLKSVCPVRLRPVDSSSLFIIWGWWLNKDWGETMAATLVRTVQRTHHTISTHKDGLWGPFQDLKLGSGLKPIVGMVQKSYCLYFPISNPEDEDPITCVRALKEIYVLPSHTGIHSSTWTKHSMLGGEGGDRDISYSYSLQIYCIFECICWIWEN